MEIKLSFNTKKTNSILAIDFNTPKKNIINKDTTIAIDNKCDDFDDFDKFADIKTKRHTVNNIQKSTVTIINDDDEDDYIDNKELLDIYYKKIEKINNGLRNRLEAYNILTEQFSGEDITLDYLICKSNKVLLDYLNYKIINNIKLSMNIIEATNFVKENIIITFWIVYKFIIQDDILISSDDICDHIHDISSESKLIKKYKTASYTHFISKNILEREIDIIKTVNINSIINEV